MAGCPASNFVPLTASPQGSPRTFRVAGELHSGQLLRRSAARSRIAPAARPRAARKEPLARASCTQWDFSLRPRTSRSTWELRRLRLGLLFRSSATSASTLSNQLEVPLLPSRVSRAELALKLLRVPLIKSRFVPWFRAQIAQCASAFHC